MTCFEIWTIIISVFTAIGTCGATILSLYFWFNDKKVKLSIRVLHADSYGIIPMDGGCFVVNITNNSDRNLLVETVGLCIYKKSKFLSYTKKIAFLMFENTEFDSLPKKIMYGESYTYVCSMNGIAKKAKALKLTDSKIKIKLFIILPTVNRDILFELDKEVEKALLKIE